MLANYATTPAPSHRLEHPRHANVVFNERSKRFSVNDNGKARSVRGIHALIDHVHRPPPDPVLNKLKSEHHKMLRHQKPHEWEAYRRFAEACTARGVDGGTIVHEEMEKFVRYGEAEFRSFVPTPHPYTQRLIQWIKRVEVTPLRTEFAIYDDKNGLDFATKIDMVVWNPRARVIEVWEIKTGYDVVFGHATGKMRMPFGRVYNNSHLDRARLQAHLAALVLKHRYGIHAVPRVVLVNETCVGSKLLTPQQKAAEDTTYRQLVAFVQDPRSRGPRKVIRKRAYHPASAGLRGKAVRRRK